MTKMKMKRIQLVTLRRRKSMMPLHSLESHLREMMHYDEQKMHEYYYYYLHYSEHQNESGIQ